MNCMNCGAPLTESAYCPKCGCDVVVQKQAIILSGLYYNQGLEKAGIRDLSGAIDQLKRSLKFNKLNIPARNLLGLIYFETGEVVAALSEWVISKNIQPEHNIATEYIDRLQKDANKLDVINQTIKKYNLALQNCKEGHEDVALIQLKKILVQNPKLIKGYHLLALLYIRMAEYEKARKILKKAIKIDKTNTTTLRFLREVDEQTGQTTSLEPRFNLWGGKFRDRDKDWDNESDKKPESGQNKGSHAIYYKVNNDTVVQPPAYKDTSIFSTILTIGLGFLVGAAMVWFLFVPARTQTINRIANEKVSEYSAMMASQTAEMTNLQNELESLKATYASSTQDLEEAEKKIESYEYLIQASGALAREDYPGVGTFLAEVDQTLLSATAKEAYNSIYSTAKTTVYRQLKENGMNAFDNEDYESAIEYLAQAYEASEEPDYEVMNYLAHAYRHSGRTTDSDLVFQAIIDAFPGTDKAERAKRYLSTYDETTGTVTNTGGTTQPTVTQPTVTEPEETDPSEEEDTSAGTGEGDTGEGIEE